MSKGKPIYIISNRAGFVGMCRGKGLSPNNPRHARQITRVEDLRGLDRDAEIIIGSIPVTITTTEIYDCGYRNIKWGDGTPFFQDGNK